MSLHLKYRPKTLEEIRGNTEVVSTLDRMLDNIERCPHSFLLHGETGCGKTTVARIIAERLQCKGADLQEVDVADYRGIDTVREIIRNSQYKPLESVCRVWILDEAHKLTNDAQNALLKTLEKPPQHVYFILCTTEPHKLIATIKGRCSQFQMRPLNDRQMYRLLTRVASKENDRLEDEVCNQIVQDSFGLPRNALKILNQVLEVPDEQRLQIAKQSAKEQVESIELCRALIKQESWKRVSSLLNNLRDQEPEGIRRHVLAYSQSVLLKGENDVAAHVIEEFWEPFYNIGFPGLVYACYSVIKK